MVAVRRTNTTPQSSSRVGRLSNTTTASRPYARRLDPGGAVILDQLLDRPARRAARQGHRPAAVHSSPKTTTADSSLCRDRLIRVAVSADRRHQARVRTSPAASARTEDGSSVMRGRRPNSRQTVGPERSSVQHSGPIDARDIAYWTAPEDCSSSGLLAVALLPPIAGSPATPSSSRTRLPQAFTPRCSSPPAWPWPAGCSCSPRSPTTCWPSSHRHPTRARVPSLDLRRSHA